MAASVPVAGSEKVPQQSLFLYRFRIFNGVHANIELPNLALGVWVIASLESSAAGLFGLLGAIGSVIALVVCINIAGQFCCYPKGDFRKIGSCLNATFMLVSLILSAYWTIWMIFISAWCGNVEDGQNSEFQDICGRIKAAAALAVIGSVFRLVTALLMIPFCCCGWRGTKEPKVAPLDV
jgi:hypothetical protein|tara:strand:- start:552 stop:1091 length:540 start_codon:yes stop_codon:yes gene_type:complete